MTEMMTREDLLHWARMLPVPATVADVAISNTQEIIVGWSFVETTGLAPATVQLLDGVDSGGVGGIEIALSTGQSATENTGGWCLRFSRGVFLNVITGSVRGSVWVADLPPGRG